MIKLLENEDFKDTEKLMDVTNFIEKHLIKVFDKANKKIISIMKETEN
jgi:hypothetical protein